MNAQGIWVTHTGTYVRTYGTAQMQLDVHTYMPIKG